MLIFQSKSKLNLIFSFWFLYHIIRYKIELTIFPFWSSKLEQARPNRASFSCDNSSRNSPLSVYLDKALGSDLGIWVGCHLQDPVFSPMNKTHSSTCIETTDYYELLIERNETGRRSRTVKTERPATCEEPNNDAEEYFLQNLPGSSIPVFGLISPPINNILSALVFV